MNPNPFLGVFLHAIGGLAAASFYIPFKRVKKWAWESYWLVGGLFSWLVMPWVISLLVCPDVLRVLREVPSSNLMWAFFFGMLWGVGGLTFGLSMRYLGMSLGYALALGFCAAFGTLIPPLFMGKLPAMLASLDGQVTLMGTIVCLAGIGVCGRAGVAKELELSAEEKQETIKEFSFTKGVWVATFAGIMSACMAFGIQAGKPIAELATELGTPEIWSNSPTYIVIFAGGLLVNALWCLALNMKNKTWRDYLTLKEVPYLANLLFSAAAGITWYLQFMFYGMGTTQMGKYDFSSWTIHMAFIIVFSNLWGLYFHEWKGSSRRTLSLVTVGILVLVASTLVVGAGNYLATLKP